MTTPLLLSNLLFGGFGSADLDAQAEAALAKLMAKYGEPLLGTTRATFLSKNYVLKFPLNANGNRANDWEGSVSADHLARGRWLQIEGFICVMQERLVELDWNNTKYTDLPDWVECIDCGQVGYDKQGNLKAFDFGR